MSQSAPVRIRLRYADLDTFVEKFAPNVTRGGVFLPSRHVQPIGAVLSFEIQLAGGEVVLAGAGRVTWVRQFDPAEPTRAFGMGVQFTAIDGASKPVLARILRWKETTGRTGGERRATGAFIPVGAAGGGAGAVNGKSATAMPTSTSTSAAAAAATLTALPPVDTTVDLAAEYGFEEATLRRVVDRIWMLGTRFDDVDFGELMKSEPAEKPTLAQALAELPRLLDPQSSRRRMATGTFRTLEAMAAAAGDPLTTPPPRARTPALGRPASAALAVGEPPDDDGTAAERPSPATTNGQAPHAAAVSDPDDEAVGRGDPSA